MEQEVQRQVDLILERDRLVREERERLDEEAARAEHEHSLIYTNTMLPEYGSSRTASYRPSVIHKTVPPTDPNAELLQELLANQKGEFDEFKQTVLASYQQTPLIHTLIQRSPSLPTTTPPLQTSRMREF
ncbi:hypothetical protein LIER_19024 [Lithospermum erythrorhizon]|uniref:Uncharacterized protein n=1 Tax=Lithospermum erythrorhizon TaxID=34254 RepID=A0AAV3QIU0_LITER